MSTQAQLKLEWVLALIHLQDAYTDLFLSRQANIPEDQFRNSIVLTAADIQLAD